MLAIAVMAFALVAFLFVLDYSINPSGKWPWSIKTDSITTNTAANTNLVINTASATTPLLTAGWHYYPNFQDVRGTQQAGDIVWAATQGGIIEFNTKTKSSSSITMNNGLHSNLATSIVYDTATKYLWIGNQGGALGTKYGVTKYDTVKHQIVKFYSNPSDETDVFRNEFPATYDGLISGSNVLLRQDPFTGDIWAATFKGISKYVATKDTWDSYGSGGDINFAGVRDIGFTKESIWIFVTPNAYSNGGMLSLDRSTKQWVAHNETNGLLLDRDNILFTTIDNDVWAVGRPNDWVSIEKSRFDDVYRLPATTDKWEKITQVNVTLLASDAVRTVTTVDGKLVLGVTRKDTSTVEMAIEPSTLNVTIQAVTPTFLDQYGDDIGYPSEMNILYTDHQDGLMTSSGMLFDTKTGRLDTTIHQAIKTLKIQQKNIGDLRPMSCNQWNSSTQDVLMEIQNEMGGGTFGIFSFHRSSQLIDTVVSAELWNDAVGSGTVLTCSTDAVIILDTSGTWEYNLSSKLKNHIDNGFISFKKFLGFDGTTAYYTATNGQLGLYNTKTQTHSYVTFQLPSGLTIDNLRYHTTNAQSVWFTAMPSGDTNKPVTSAYKFNTTTGTWTTFSLAKKLISEEQITTIQGAGNDVWLMTNLSPYILRASESQFIPAEKDFQTAMMGVNVQSVYPTSTGIWFTHGVGLWGYVKY